MASQTGRQAKSNRLARRRHYILETPRQRGRAVDRIADAELVERARSGDRGAFGALIKRRADTWGVQRGGPLCRESEGVPQATYGATTALMTSISSLLPAHSACSKASPICSSGKEWDTTFVNGYLFFVRTRKSRVTGRM